MSIEEIAAKGILGLQAPPPKILEEVEPITAEEAEDGEGEEEVPISTDSLPIVDLDEVPLPLDDFDNDVDEEKESGGGDLVSNGFIQVIEASVEVVEVEREIAPEAPLGTVAGSGSTEKENVVWPDDATHEFSDLNAVPDYIAKPKRMEIEPFNEDDIQQSEQTKPFEQPTIILDAPTFTSTNADENSDEDTPAAYYEEVSAEDYAQEFNIVLERCDDGSGFASNDSADAENGATTVKEDYTTNPCVRVEPTFVGCADANLLFGASNPFDGTVIKTTVAFSYDLYLPNDVKVDEAVDQLEETMLRHVAGGMNFDRCGALANDDADDGEGRLLTEDSEEEISFVGLRSRPIDYEDATYQRCTSNLSSIGEDVEIKCVPMKGRMTLYLSPTDDRYAARQLIKAMVESGAEDGAFVGDGGILGVAYVEDRALESAKLPGNNLEQFKASAGMR